MKDIWNGASLRPDRPLVKRDYCWASELNKSMIDRYLTMNAVTPTNPPNARSRRKFLAGNIWEDIQGIITSALGLRTELQQEVWTHGALSVKGKIDFMIQGMPDYSIARDKINKMPFSAELNGYLLSVVDKFEQQIGQREFAPMIRECKSCSEYVIDMIQEGGCVIGHKLQLYHYLKGLNIPLGYVDYLSKNDALMEDTRVEYPDVELEDKYNRDLVALKGYLEAGEQPPKEPLIVFEGKFKKNFNVEYSSYLKLIYNFAEPLEYSNAVKSDIGRWNRVLLRIKDVEEGKQTKTGKPILLTDKNKIVIAEMEQQGLNAFDLAKKAQIEDDDEAEET